jgi:hypothetical protein
MIEVIEAREDGIYVDPQERAPGLSDRTAAVIRSLLDADPDARPATARDVIKRLGLRATQAHIRGRVYETARAIRDDQRSGKADWVKKAAPVAAPAPKAGSSRALIVGGFGILALMMLLAMMAAGAAVTVALM